MSSQTDANFTSMTLKWLLPLSGPRRRLLSFFPHAILQLCYPLAIDANFHHFYALYIQGKTSRANEQAISFKAPPVDDWMADSAGWTWEC